MTENAFRDNMGLRERRWRYRANDCSTAYEADVMTLQWWEEYLQFVFFNHLPLLRATVCCSAWHQTCAGQFHTLFSRCVVAVLCRCLSTDASAKSIETTVTWTMCGRHWHAINATILETYRLVWAFSCDDLTLRWHLSRLQPDATIWHVLWTTPCYIWQLWGYQLRHAWLN